MKEKLDRYINEIGFKVRYDPYRCEDVDDWIFEGDGEGDFEESAKGIKDKALLDEYIAYCEKQIDLAQRYKNENFE